jgi:polysaccharide deacetylase 2 family uncharacterized protein YibQ
VLKGILGGFLTGAVLSGLVLGAVSVLVSGPVEEPPEASGVDVPAGSEFDRAREDRAAELPEGDEAPQAREAPQVDAPEPDDTGSLDTADTGPAAAPEAGTADTALTTPEDTAESAGVELQGDEPVLPSPQALAPEPPDGGSDVAISTDPAQPAQPDIETESGMPGADAPAGPSDDAAAVPERSPAQPGNGPATPGDAGEGATRSDGTPAAAEGDGVPADAPEATEDEAAPAEPPMTTGDEAAPADPPVATEDETDDTPAATDDDMAPGDPPGSGAESAAQTADTGDAPSGTIGDIAENVTTDRLPTVDGEAQADAARPPPLERFAAPFDNPGDKPLMSIVLIDDGASPISLEALADFPYPISYAIDADWSGAAGAAREYRAAGLEVLAMADLPPGAAAADTEVAMQATLDAVPEAVAVMEGTGTGLQDSRAATEQLVPILQESGHGLLLFPEGLDTARKLIAREGVPAVTIFRDIDAEGQNAAAIRRFLDQAAFKARQDTAGVVVVGRLRAETVSALLLWGLQDRANSVALAPVSAILRAAGG